MEKICPRCGVSFICQPDNIAGCQCATVKLDRFQRDYVKTYYYPECLCKSCLEEIQALEMAKNKSQSNPPKKHGNMPL